MFLLAAVMAFTSSLPQAGPAAVIDTAGAEREAARYAAEHLLSPLSAGRRAFDPSVHVGYARAPQRSRELAQLLQANLAARDSVIVCGTSRGSCTMPGFSALVSLQVESIDDSTAEVSVTVEQPSTPRPPSADPRAAAASSSGARDTPIARPHRQRPSMRSFPSRLRSGDRR